MGSSLGLYRNALKTGILIAIKATSTKGDKSPHGDENCTRCPVAYLRELGGTEKFMLGVERHINRHTPHELELIKLPSPENDFATISASYERLEPAELRSLRCSDFDPNILRGWCPIGTTLSIYSTSCVGSTTHIRRPGMAAHALPSAAQALWQLIQCSDHSAVVAKFLVELKSC